MEESYIPARLFQVLAAAWRGRHSHPAPESHGVMTDEISFLKHLRPGRQTGRILFQRSNR
jgi:hypothetical protein